MVPIKTGVLGLGPFLVVMGVVERSWILAVWGAVLIGSGSAIWYRVHRRRSERDDVP